MMRPEDRRSTISDPTNEIIDRRDSDEIEDYHPSIRSRDQRIQIRIKDSLEYRTMNKSVALNVFLF